MFQSKKSDTADYPKVRDLAPRIGAELEPKILELGLEKTALLVEGRELAAAETPSSDYADQARELRIAEILGKIPPQPIKTRQGRLTEISQRVGDIDAALDILRREVETERNRAGALIRERVAPLYKKLVGDLARALVGAHAASAAYWRLIEELQADGVSIGALGDHRAAFIGAPRDRNSQLATFLRECVKDGMFAASDMPRELSA